MSNRHNGKRCPYLTHIKFGEEDIRRVCSFSIKGEVIETGKINLAANLCPYHIKAFRECPIYCEVKRRNPEYEIAEVFIPED